MQTPVERAISDGRRLPSLEKVTAGLPMETAPWE